MTHVVSGDQAGVPGQSSSSRRGGVPAWSPVAIGHHRARRHPGIRDRRDVSSLKSSPGAPNARAFSEDEERRWITSIGK